ncbi:hypothetical protein [Fibrobacter sp.]|uniref:hypothetical protein n=1 Tax=Fibrobacter sp. TaxID=35828 RepID=UPI00389107B1
MPKIGYIITLLLLALSIEVSAQSHNEFLGIPFGATRDVVIEEVMKMGYDAYDQGGHVQIPVFKFGELPVQVDFIFNKNDKFYAFELRTGRVEEARRGKTIEAVDYMSEQFTLKYGKPSQDPTVNETNLRDGRNVYQQWLGVKYLNGVTSVYKIDNRYYAVGLVEHRGLSREPLAQKKVKEKPAAAEPVF